MCSGPHTFSVRTRQYPHSMWVIITTYLMHQQNSPHYSCMDLDHMTLVHPDMFGQWSLGHTCIPNLRLSPHINLQSNNIYVRNELIDHFNRLNSWISHPKYSFCFYRFSGTCHFVVFLLLIHVMFLSLVPALSNSTHYHPFFFSNSHLHWLYIHIWLILT